MTVLEVATSPILGVIMGFVPIASIAVAVYLLLWSLATSPRPRRHSF